MAAPAATPAPTAEGQTNKPTSSSPMPMPTATPTPMPPPADDDGDDDDNDNQMADHLSDSEDVQSFEQPDADLPPLPLSSDDDFLRPGPVHGDESDFMDRRMKRQLMDVESSFILDASMHPEAAQARTGADDTYLFGGSPGTVRPATLDEESEHSASEHEAQGSSHNDDSSEQSEQSDSAPTPAGAYKTPGVHRFDADSTDGSVDSGPSILDPAPSSPAAEAAHRTQSRAVSLAGRSFTRQGETDNSRRPTSSASTVKAPDFAQTEEGSSAANERELGSFAMPPPTITTTGPKANKRPSFLANRHSSQRSSTSSFTNRSDVSGDVASLESLSADYALHAEGATPRSSRPGRNDAAMSRLPSLGSIASSMSGYSDSNPWDKYRSTSANSISGLLHPDGGLERLDEEVLSSSTTPPETPRYSGPRSSTLTDTVVARHVQDIHVPDTVAREFREKHAQSPEKRHSATPFTRSKHNLTLKEQNSKIDKLSKENFDLKLKIHFLDQALQNRSDEGVKEMISKNVQFQTDLATEKKESQSLRKKVRELERRLKAQEEGLAASKDPGSGSEDENTELPSKHAELEEEVEYLRESLETSEVTIEEWKQIALEKEAESRRMWEYIRSMKPATGDSASHEEALAMWQEDFQDEQALREEVEVRCEQAEAESERLREEMQRLKDQNHQLLQQSTASHHNSRVHTSSRLNHQSFNSRSNVDFDSNDQSRPGSNGGSSSTLVDQLQTSNDRLQRDLHAQASMLTSRNRENLRLREENEGLKLTIRRGDVGSVTGDSILERSISRNYIRSTSRASGGTRVTQMSDPERDDIEGKNAALRDELSQLKLAYKELDDQLNGHLDMLETAESKLKEMERELEAQTEDLQALSNERDEALEILQDKEQECEELRSEALDEVERLQNQLDRKQQERDRILIDLENMTEDFNALQQEMKNVSESLLQLEDDRDASLRKIQNLESELDDANQELDRQDKLLTEERAKSEKLEIQVESCQSEVDFLREEQEGDKIKIGELESALNNAQITIQDDKEKIHDMEEHATEERQQRDALENQEKQEVEKIMNELNTQLAKLKEDGRKLRKNLSSKEVDATTWKQRHDELEASMREALDNPEGTRPSFVKEINKLQRDLDSLVQELDITKSDLAEKDRLLRTRDQLLENTGVESRGLADLLERERQARRQDQAAFEAAKRGHQSVSRTIQQHEARVVELETLRSQDRQKLHSFERQYKDQLLERNNLLYALWNRLATMCGTEWSRNNSLVNGEVISMETISKSFPSFKNNLVLAIKTVESIFGTFKQRMRNLEKDFTRDYQTIEHTLDVRIKRLDQLEKLVQAQRQSIGRPSTVRGGIDVNFAEVNKLRNENKSLRTEIQTLRALPQPHEVAVNRAPSASPSMPTSSKRASMAQTLLRAHSTSIVEHIQPQRQTSGHPYPQSVPLQPSEQKWIHRLKELERRLKQEREARLLDRSGARKRLEQKVEENADLRAMLERERVKHEEDGLSVHGSISTDRRSRDRSGRASVLSRLDTNRTDREQDDDVY